MELKSSNLKRQQIPMPDFIKQALDEKERMIANLARPAYQRNDYLGWITRAKRLETVKKRLNQMLAELEQGGVYMNMKHQPSSKE
jgi:uncharacterized protein YdeI (YjbR/CyaY-like superfamily)